MQRLISGATQIYINMGQDQDEISKEQPETCTSYLERQIHLALNYACLKDFKQTFRMGPPEKIRLMIFSPEAL